MAKYIPEKHYVAWHNFAEKDALAFMTPYGTDAAAKKRMATVDSWVGSHRSATVGNVKHVLDNKAMTGFKVADFARRWVTSNVVWRITDPRGFTLEISSGNMAYILGNCNIKQGEIEDELIWVRDGKDNYLLPTSSEEFATYQRNSAAKKSNTKMSEVNVGDRISAVSGETGIYLGMYTCVRLGSGYRQRGIFESKRYHIIRDEADPQNIKHVAKTTWKDITIEERNAEEAKDFSDEINANIEHFHSPINAKYVCAGKFDIDLALSNVIRVPYTPSGYSSYFMEMNDVLYKGSHRQGTWEGQIYPFTVDLKGNMTDYTNGQQIQVTDSTRTWGWDRDKRIKPDEIKDIEKFTFAVIIDDKQYPLDI